MKIRAPKIKDKIIIDIIIFASLAIASIRFIWGIEKIMDIWLTDESFSLYRGVKLLKFGLPPASYAPLYSIWYYILSHFEKNNIHLYYLNYKILISANVLLLYIFMRRIKVIPAIAGTFSFIFLFSKNSFAYTCVTHFALLVLLVFIILATYSKSKEESYMLMGIGSLLISFIRPEFFITFVLFCIAYLFLIFKGNNLTNTRPLRFFLFIFVTFLIFFTFTAHFRSNGNLSSFKPAQSWNKTALEKSWIVFASNFSVNYAARNKINLVNPWMDWNQITRPVFGNVNTIWGAVTNNPNEFTLHILTNICNYIGNSLNSLLIRNTNYISPYWVISGSCLLYNVAWRLELIFFISTVIYLFKKRIKLIKILKSKISISLLIISLFVFIPVFLSSIVIFPSYHSLIIQTAIILILLSYCVSNVIKDDSKLKNLGFFESCVAGLFIIILTPNVVQEWSFVPSKIEIKRSSTWRANLNLVNAINFLQSLKIDKQVNLLSSRNTLGVYLDIYFYLPDNYNSIPGILKNSSFDEFISNYKISMVILSESIRNDKNFTNDIEFQRFIKYPELFGFMKINIYDTDMRLFIRKDLLKQE